MQGSMPVVMHDPDVSRRMHGSTCMDARTEPGPLPRRTRRSRPVSQPSVIQPPAGRYGPDRTARRRPAWLVPAAVVALLAAVVIVWLGTSALRDPVQWQDVGFSIAGPERIDVTFEVTKDAAATVRCDVTALSRSFAQVGIASVELGPATDRVQRVTLPVATAELAVTGTVDACVVVGSR